MKQHCSIMLLGFIDWVESRSDGAHSKGSVVASKRCLPTTNQTAS